MLINCWVKLNTAVIIAWDAVSCSSWWVRRSPSSVDQERNAHRGKDTKHENDPKQRSILCTRNTLVEHILDHVLRVCD